MTARTAQLAGLYRAERGRIGRLIQRLVRNRATTDDLVHDAFVSLIERGSAARDRRAYLARIARNLAIDHCRSQKVHVTLEEVDLFALRDPTPSAERAVIDREKLAMAISILAKLPERTRQAFEMHRLGEQTLAEIALSLGVSTAHAGRLVMQGYCAVRDGIREIDLD